MSAASGTVRSLPCSSRRSPKPPPVCSFPTPWSWWRSHTKVLDTAAWERCTTDSVGHQQSKGVTKRYTLQRAWRRKYLASPATPFPAITGGVVKRDGVSLTTLPVYGKTPYTSPAVC
nr:MAG TPA: hypothetical protein [Caudoviricetes sp.]